jgi:FKBP-type peptidyl-prolyl cis-trans isomerase FkpA
MLKKLSGYTLALIGLNILFSSCQKDYESIQSVDAKKITDYISKNNLSGLMKEDSLKSGYYYQILTPGTGTNFKNTDSVLYNGVVQSLENGTVYLTTNTNGNLGTYVGYTNTLNGASIPAIRDVLAKLKPGGRARIILPSYLAFGKNGLDASNIPSNENIDLYINTYPEKVQWQLDDRLLQAFIATKGLSMIKDQSRVYYSISTPGSGTDIIYPTSTITAKYTVRYLDGTVLDSSTDGTFSSVLSSLAVKGWEKILPGRITAGGKVRILIPSDLAYGTAGSTTITANACLDFDIEITAVTN